MASITLKNREGGDAGTTVLSPAIFGIEPNVPVMHQVVTAQLAAKRSGTQSTKTRSEVRGGGAKPWKQKGTGRARAGSSRSPIWRGGGVALGPKPRSYAQRTPKKMIRLALRSALSDRAADGKVVVIDSWGFETPRTKDAIAALGALGLEGRILVVLRGDDVVTWKCFRNLPEVHLIESDQLNAYDVLCSDYVVFTSETLPSTDEQAPPVKAVREPKPKAEHKPKPARLPKVERAIVQEDADMGDLAKRPPTDPSKKKAVIKDTDRVKSANDKLDPKFEAARAKAEHQAQLRAKAEEAKAVEKAVEADEAEAAKDEPAPEAPKKSGGFSFNNPTDEA